MITKDDDELRSLLSSAKICRLLNKSLSLKKEFAETDSYVYQNTDTCVTEIQRMIVEYFHFKWNKPSLWVFFRLNICTTGFITEAK